MAIIWPGKDSSVGSFQDAKPDKNNSSITVEWEEAETGEQKLDKQTATPKPAEKKVELDKTTEKKKKTPKWLEEKE